MVAVRADPSAVRRVVICTGKIYYDLWEEQSRRGASDVFLIRIEQLFPLRIDLINEELSCLPDDVNYFWVQEEPENMGAWQYVRSILAECCGSIRFIGRPADSCPAVGSHHLHLQQQAEVVKSAFEVQISSKVD